MTEIIIKSHNDNNNLQNVTSGESFENFLESQKTTVDKKGLSTMGAYNLRASTEDILNHCNPHDAVCNSETTHLVVGYVQSGKTMSFTGVLAMAKDNGYRIAIVLSGITTNLLYQTSQRLSQDLNCNSLDSFRLISNPTQDDVGDIVKKLRISSKPLIVIPILKHRKYIDELSHIFSNPKVKSIIESETVLIIDDEADQASLNGYERWNTSHENEYEESAIYAAIYRLRSHLPGNSYIQYTATPQANILIPLTDLLSPKSHTLLTPGEDYVGGKKFFGLDNGKLYNGKLIREIPSEEVYHKKHNALKKMPQSLREALIMHMWAVILVVKWYKRANIKQLSMMVHPTDIIEGNKAFEGWIKKELDSWSDILEKPETHEDRVFLMGKFESYLSSALEFYPSDNRPSFEELKGFIPDIINDCAVYRITGESEDDSYNIPWNSHCMNVLVGAQMLNRGFTLEKLATTYMPRYTVSITNADTIEQRCRFFGYKMDYIESCRVYLPKKSIDDYIYYVRHEEELRNVLSSCSTLKDYEHSVMLNPKLRPTRLNVIPKTIVQKRLKGWIKFENLSTDSVLEHNRKIITQFVQQYKERSVDFNLLSGYNSAKYAKGEIKKHSACILKGADVADMLVDFTPATYNDVLNKSFIIRYIHYLESIQKGNVQVIFMSSDIVRERHYHSKSDQGFTKVPLFQGKSNINEKDDYCGDTNIYDPNIITIQIHHLSVGAKNASMIKNIETYSIAVHFPKSLEIAYTSSVKD